MACSRYGGMVSNFIVSEIYVLFSMLYILSLGDAVLICCWGLEGIYMFGCV